MLPDLTLLVALAVGFLPWASEDVDPLRSLLGTAAVTLVGSAWILLSARRVEEGLVAGEEGPALLTARSGAVWALLAWWTALQVFAWPALVREHVPRVWWMARY